MIADILYFLFVGLVLWSSVLDSIDLAARRKRRRERWNGSCRRRRRRS